MYGAVEERIHAFVTSVLDGGKDSPSSPGQGIPGTDWVRGGSLPDAIWTLWTTNSGAWNRRR